MSDHHTHGDQPIADQLAKDARAKEARMLPEEGLLTTEQLQWSTEEFRALIGELEVSASDVAKQIGKPIAAVVDLFNGRYTRGDIHMVARHVMRWVLQMQDADREGRTATYITTETADKMMGILIGTHAVRMMGVIVGPSGISKSTVCRAAAAGLIPGSVHIELTQAHGRPVPLVRLISRRTGGTRNAGSLSMMMEALIDSLAGTGRLLMIDEAHYLTRDGCNALRDLHKQTGCPIVMVGARDVLDTISDFTEFTGQFKRLIAYTLNITEELAATGRPLYTPREISSFCKSMRLRLTRDGLDEATELACLLGWGGLGSLRALLLNARTIAEMAEQSRKGDGRINREIIRKALREMEGATGFDRVRLRASRKTERRAVG